MFLSQPSLKNMYKKQKEESFILMENVRGFSSQASCFKSSRAADNQTEQEKNNNVKVEAFNR